MSGPTSVTPQSHTMGGQVQVNLSPFARDLRNLKAELDVTQSELATILKIPKATLKKYLRDDAQPRHIREAEIRIFMIQASEDHHQKKLRSEREANKPENPDPDSEEETLEVEAPAVRPLGENDRRWEIE